MLLAHRTPPAMSLGVRADAETAVRAGILHIQFAQRPEEDAVAIDEYLKALKPVPSPRLVNGKLSPAALRAGHLVRRSRSAAPGVTPQSYIPTRGCTTLLARDRSTTRASSTLPLIECWRTAPYNHDGRYTTVKELLTTGNHGEAAAKLSGTQIDELVEFVESL
jgi:hypothetical protein